MEAIDRTYHFKKTLEKKERFVGAIASALGLAARGSPSGASSGPSGRRTVPWWATPPAAWR